MSNIPWAPDYIAIAAFGVICFLAGMLPGLFIGLYIQYSEYHEYEKRDNNVDA